MNTADGNEYSMSGNMGKMLARRRVRESTTKLIEAIIFILLLVFVVLPIAWGIITSFKDNKEVLAYPPKIFNFTPVLDSYKTVFNSGYLRSLFYSIFTRPAP
jgi:ABC-type sugar transport system, permease component